MAQAGRGSGPSAGHGVAEDDVITDVMYRLRALFRRGAADRELAEEVGFHFQQQVEKNLRAGMPRDAAIRDARMRLGGVTQVQEQCREARGTAALAALAQDVRFGARMMMKERGFTAATALILALGIGATTVTFALVDAILIRPLPYPDAERLVFLTEAYEGRPGMSISYANFQDWQAQNAVFTSIGGTQPRALTLTGKGLPRQLDARCVTHDFLRTLGLPMYLGRDFTAQDDTEAANPTAILGYGLWQREFGGDRSIVGRSIVLNDRSFAVIGVAPPNVYYRNQQPDVYVPLGVIASAEERSRRNAHGGMYAVARMKQGVTLEQVRSNMELIAQRLQQQYPETNLKNSASVRPLREYIGGEVRTGLLMLLCAVGLLLLIACANAANLVLARASSRAGELAIRVSLGASRARLVAQMLTESMMVAALGGVLGVVLAFWGTAYLVRAVGNALPRVGEIAVNAPVLAFAVAVTLGTGVLFGALPAWHVSKANINTVLKRGSGGSAGVERARLRGALIVGELALSFALLVGAGLLVRSFMRVLQVDPGFNPQNVLTATTVLSATKYPTERAADQVTAEMLRNIRAIPGVVAAAAVVPMPLSGSEWDSNYILEGETITKDFHGTNNEVGYIDTEYLKAMQIPVVKGRGFSTGDSQDAPPVLLVNEAFAQHVWPNQDPLGKRIHLLTNDDMKEGNSKPQVWSTVVGVIGNVKQYGLDTRAVPTLYFPFAQPSDPKDPLLRRDLVIRTTVDPLSVVEQVRHAVAMADAEQAVSGFETMEQYVAESVASRKLYMVLLTLFASAAAVLAAIGIYGVIAYWVGERRREIGIRIAVGAQRATIFKLVLGRSARLVIFGTVVGAVASVALARGLRSLLFGVEAMDVKVFCGVAATLAIITLVASYVPALGATRISPMEAIRCE